MHGLEVGGVAFDDCFEIIPLSEQLLVLGGVGRVVLVDEFVELSVEEFYFLFSAFVHLSTPLHFMFINWTQPKMFLNVMEYSIWKVKKISKGQLAIALVVSPRAEPLIVAFPLPFFGYDPSSFFLFWWVFLLLRKFSLIPGELLEKVGVKSYIHTDIERMFYFFAPRCQRIINR